MKSTDNRYMALPQFLVLAEYRAKEPPREWNEQEKERMMFLTKMGMAAHEACKLLLSERL